MDLLRFPQSEPNSIDLPIKRNPRGQDEASLPYTYRIDRAPTVFDQGQGRDYQSAHPLFLIETRCCRLRGWRGVFMSGGRHRLGAACKQNCKGEANGAFHRSI